MYYSKIGVAKFGLTNQIFSFINSIIIAYKNNEKVVIVDNFLDDFSKQNYTPISKIFNINKINIFLKKTYDIIIIDKYDVNLKINSIKYGTVDNNVDLTDYIIQNYYKNNVLCIKKDINFNSIKGDPCLNIKKNVFLNYTINDYLIDEIYQEILTNNISIDILNSEYKNTFDWINTYDKIMFENILINIYYNIDFIEKSKNILQKIDINKKINVIHLRIEDDAIQHWSKMNNMSMINFKTYIENKYINLIQKFISKTDENIILSHSINNNVVNFLKKNNYSCHFNEKYFEDREKNAIIDLITTNYCNNIFIGNFNFKKLNGSTFSYYIGKRLNNNIKKICIDLDKIYDNAMII